MNGLSILQSLKYHNFGVDEVTGGTLSDTEWDTKGLKQCQVVFAFGTLGAAGITALSVHANDTSGFTAGAGNLIASFTGADLPADANDRGIWVVDIPEAGIDGGRYVQVIVTAGANACDCAAIGIGVGDELPSSASTRGVTKEALSSPIA